MELNCGGTSDGTSDGASPLPRSFSAVLNFKTRSKAPKPISSDQSPTFHYFLLRSARFHQPPPRA
jgi:hypothetical protein